MSFIKKTSTLRFDFMFIIYHIIYFSHIKCKATCLWLKSREIFLKVGLWSTEYTTSLEPVWSQCEWSSLSVLQIWFCIDGCLTMEAALLSVFIPSNSCFSRCPSHSHCPCLTSSSWMQWETCWIWSQLWSLIPTVHSETSNSQGWGTARHWSRSELETSQGVRPVTRSTQQIHTAAWKRCFCKLRQSAQTFLSSEYLLDVIYQTNQAITMKNDFL